MGFVPFLSCVFLYCWDEFMNYILQLVFSIMLPFKMLINNNNNRGLVASKCKFILTQPSP